MTENNQRAAAICETCGTVHAVRRRSDGEIRPLGIGSEAGCPCGDGDLRIMDTDTALPESTEK
ncbi:hypothetical protein [Halovivax limisalsi]|uniref:hypothetical protein n=1 Tax=Halovivax limisalsi TaxID=1453760 RepID=UPI001FFCB71A|nr:hypothetical protein [Halovivax limisalsi]